MRLILLCVIGISISVYLTCPVHAQSQCAGIDPAPYKSVCASLSVPAIAYAGESYTVTANLGCGSNGTVSLSYAANNVVVDGIPVTATAGIGYLYFSEIQTLAGVKVPITGAGEHIITFTIRNDAPAACVQSQGSFLSGPWAHVSGGNFSTSVPFVIARRVVTPATVLSAPEVTVNGNSATLLLQKFTSASKQRAQATTLRAVTKKEKINFVYEVTVKRVADLNGNKVKNDIRKKTSKRNELTLKNLKGGIYQANYRVILTKKQNGRTVGVGKTKFSPVTGFAVN